jgi:subtilisin family serine protease
MRQASKVIALAFNGLLFGGILSIVSGCQKEHSKKSVSVSQKLDRAENLEKDKPSNELTTYVARFTSPEEALAHHEEVIRAGGTTQKVDGSQTILEVNVPEATLSQILVPEESLLAGNTSWRSAERSPVSREVDSAALAQSLLSARDVTGVRELQARFPEADGRNTTVAIIDTGIDFGLKGISTFADGSAKVQGYFDFTEFGKVAVNPAPEIKNNEITIHSDSYLLEKSDRLLKVTGIGMLSEESLAQIMKEPAGVDINSNDSASDSFAFLTVELTDGKKGIWFDANQDKTFSAKNEIIRDFNETKDFIETNFTSKRGGGAIAVSLPADGGVQFHTILGGHGTSCASIVSGENYLGGKVNGMAPKSKLLSYALDATGRDVYSSSTLLKYFLHAKSQKADALSVSWGFAAADAKSAQQLAQILDAELGQSGILVGIAAGNEGPSTFSAAPDDYIPRLGFGLGAAVTQDQARNVYKWLDVKGDHVVHYSSSGPTRLGRAMPDLIAPLMSMVRDENNGTGNSFIPFGGTSSATPAFVGAATTLLSVLKAQSYPIDMNLLKSALLSSARPLEGVPSIRQGAGMVNVNKAYDIYLSLLPEKNSGHVARDKTLVAKVTLPSGKTMEGMVSQGYVSHADVTLSFLDFPSSRDPLAVDYIEVLTLKSTQPWLVAPEVVTLQEGGASFPVKVDPAVAKKPGVYTDEITLVDAQGMIRHRIPVVIHISSLANENQSFFQWKGNLEPFSIQKFSIKVDQEKSLNLTGMVQLPSPAFVSGSLVLRLTDLLGHIVAQQRLSLSGNGAAISWQVPALSEGVYELQVYQQTGKSALPIYVALGAESVPFSLVQDQLGGETSWLIKNELRRPLTKVEVVALGRQIEIPLIWKESNPIPAFEGVFEFKEEESWSDFELGIFQRNTDRVLDPWLSLATAIKNGMMGTTLDWRWMPVSSHSKPLYQEVSLENEGSQLSIESYPNVGEYSKMRLSKIFASLKTKLKNPVSFTLERKEDTQSDWLLEVPSSLGNGDLWVGELRLWNGDQPLTRIQISKN